MENSLTQIKYNKTSCYFCNEWLDNNDGFKNHITQCGQTLEKCPNHCTAYVQRKLIEKHLKECPKTISPTNSLDTNTSRLSPTKEDFNDIEKKLLIFEQDIGNLRAALNEETRQRHRLIVDVGNLRKQNQISDEWTNKVGDVLAALKKCLNEETESRCIDIQQCKVDINRLLFQYQQMEDWRVEARMQLDNVLSGMVDEENIRAHIDVLVTDTRISAMKICNLENDLTNLKLHFTEKKIDSSSASGLLMEKLSIVDKILEDHHEAMSTAAHDNNSQINNLKSEQQFNKKLLSELKTKQITLDFELKAIKHIATETEDKCDKLEKLVVDAKQTTYQLKQKLSDLELNLNSQKRWAGIQNTRGHLIWRIDEYPGKLKDSKENDIMLRSPLFCNKQYGYTLRLDVHLNGIGTWKGRNLIACLTVVNGEWDPLLLWPCTIKADIILRDQTEDVAEAKDCVKTIVAKRKNDKFEQNQYIHIPHKTISNASFLRNDAIFIEVRVNKNV